MKPNPEQDADRAAFEKWTTREPGTYAYHHECGAWQAAKADSRAVEYAFEQVCHRLDNIKYALNNEANALHTIGNEVSYGLVVAAPFRKTGV